MAGQTNSTAAGAALAVRLKAWAQHEVMLLSILGTYLAVCFSVVTFHAWAQGGEVGKAWHLIGVSVFKAYLIAHLVTIGHRFRLGETAPHYPLALRAFFRALGLTGAVALLTPIEELLHGLLRGEPVFDEIEAWTQLDPWMVAARLLLVLLLLMPVGVALEMMRDLSPELVRKLMLETQPELKLVTEEGRTET
jgi:hypothetical protein